MPLPPALFLTLLLVAGCAGPSPPIDRNAGAAETVMSIPANTNAAAGSVDANATSVSSKPQNTATPLVFFDSRVFDRDLSSAMRSGLPEIVVDVPIGFSLNEIPVRVDRWLYSVKDSGGEVKAEPAIRNRGIFTAAIDVIVSFFSKLDEHHTFAPSDQYRATLVYAPNGDVQRIVFNHR